LIGDWERTNEPEGQQTYESWEIISATEYSGHGYTIKNKDTTFQEFMRLHKTDTTWALEVAGPNDQPVSFKMTSKKENMFIVENPEHDFPNKISYLYYDNTIKAVVSGQGMEVPFIFWRVED